ncbi:MAG: 4Fe-4S binding protein, partial [Thermodesulfobacteriota bacterium]
MIEHKSFGDLRGDVVDKGLCTSCGTCAGVCPLGVIDLAGDEWEPQLAGDCNFCGLCYAVCPGKSGPMPAIEKHLFGRRRDEGN